MCKWATPAWVLGVEGLTGLGRPTPPWVPSAPGPIPNAEAPPSTFGTVETPGRTWSSEECSCIDVMISSRSQSLYFNTQAYTERSLTGVWNHECAQRKTERSRQGWTPDRGGGSRQGIPHVWKSSGGFPLTMHAWYLYFTGRMLALSDLRSAYALRLMPRM